jgi:hypothetical protein
MSIANFLLADNNNRVLFETQLIGKQIAWRFSQLNKGNFHVAIDVQITDFNDADLVKPIQSGVIDSDPLKATTPPSSLPNVTTPFMFANSSMDMGNAIIHDTMLQAWAGYLALSYLSDELDANKKHLAHMVKVTYKFSDGTGWWYHSYIAFWNTKDGAFTTKKLIPTKH